MAQFEAEAERELFEHALEVAGESLTALEGAIREAARCARDLRPGPLGGELRAERHWARGLLARALIIEGMLSDLLDEMPAEEGARDGSTG